MIYVLFRFALAIFLAVMLARLVMKFLGSQGLNGSPRDQVNSNKSSDDCIEICPECGRMKDKNHRCP